MRIFVNIVPPMAILFILSCFISPEVLGPIVIESVQTTIVSFFEGFEWLLTTAMDNPLVTIPIVTIALVTGAHSS